MFDFDAHQLFKGRLSRHVRELSRYFRYIFNGHIAFAMLFFVSALAYYYKTWLEDLPDQFPSFIVIGLVCAFVLSISPIRTLLKEADLVFLLAAEQKLKPYFRGALLYSFASQLYVSVLAAAILGPLYFASRPETTGRSYLLLTAVLIVFKLWNLLASWNVKQIRIRNFHFAEIVVRFILNAVVFWALAKGDVLVAGVATGLFALLVAADFMLAKKEAGLSWENLIAREQAGMQAFYRFANLFTDVPHLKDRVKRRRWLVVLLDNVPFRQQSAYDYLYRRTVARSGDYFGMYVRLVVIGGLAIWFVPNVVMKLLFALLFLYMATFQMVPLFKQHRTILWIDIYPVPEKVRRKSALDLIFRMAVVQVLVFAVVFAVQMLWAGSAIAFAGGLLFSYLFIFKYAAGKMN